MYNCCIIFLFAFCSGMPFDGEEKPNVAHVKMYLRSTVKSKKTVLDYTWLSMVAEIGGYTGLLLGVSVVNITSLVDRYILNKSR